jgi:stage III sporulation protein AF
MDSMTTIYDFIKSIVIFLLLAKILEYLIPSGSMKKYFRLFSGIILMIIVINPIIKHNGLLEKLNYNVIKNEFQLNSSDLNKVEQDEYNKIRNDIALKIYKDKIEIQIKELLKQENITAIKVKVSIEEDFNNEEYGVIREVHLTAKKGYEKNDNTVDDIKINKIVIGKNNNKNTIKSAEDIILEKKIKKIINNFYKVASDNIYITIETC